MYPHERSLVKKLQGKAVALLGVNSDKDRDDLKKVMQKEEITWRSWCDGNGGPIAKRWEIHAWPTIYIIDAKGVIRAKDDKGEFVGHPEYLELAVTLLLRDSRADLTSRTLSKATKAADNAPSSMQTKKPAESISPAGKENTEQVAAIKFQFAQTLADDGKVQKAKERCEEILKKYPKTAAALDARNLLEKLGK